MNGKGLMMDIKDYIISHTVGNLYWKDTQGKYLGCNANFARLVGFSSQDEIIGKTDKELLSNLLSEDRIKAIVALDQVVMNSGEEQIAQEIGINEFKEIVSYISKKSPLKDNTGNIIGIVGNSIDASNFDHVKNFIISHTAGNLYWKDLEGRYLGCNESFAQLLNLNSPLDIIGKNDYDFFLDESNVKNIIETDRTVMLADAEITLEEIGTGSDGGLATYLTKKTPLKDKNNKVMGIVGTSIDITKQKQAQAAKAEFLRNMSHDIRTPLVGIYSLAKLLYDEEIDPQKKESIADIFQSAERLTALLNQVLEIAKFGNYSVHYSEFIIDNLIYESVGLMFAATKSKNISLTFKSENQLIKSDRLRISKILLNILGNAVKFTPNGGKIHLEVETTAPFLKINIEDTGMGISADKLDFIFEQFTKLTASHAFQHFSGSGIGLYIAKQYVTELGGEITVKSQLEKGSIFSFSVPNLIDC